MLKVAIFAGTLSVGLVPASAQITPQFELDVPAEDGTTLIDTYSTTLSFTQDLQPAVSQLRLDARYVGELVRSENAVAAQIAAVAVGDNVVPITPPCTMPSQPLDPSVGLGLLATPCDATALITAIDQLLLGQPMTNTDGTTGVGSVPGAYPSQQQPQSALGMNLVWQPVLTTAASTATAIWVSNMLSSDDEENSPTTDTAPLIDTDRDGIPDPEDTDGDGTSLNDDCDGDGLIDLIDPRNCVIDDTDGDGLMDGFDPAPASALSDIDSDGILDQDEDANGNGNPLDDDADNDGIPNVYDRAGES